TASGSFYTVTITPPFILPVASVVLFQLRHDGSNTAGNNISFSYAISNLGQPIVVELLNLNSGALNGTINFGYFIVT
ncbi:MAG TPA: hypothetical protein VNY36_03205, partial [Bacteroidia bacterium]|nr:hypothetical protein [Bacteroidia bacterium]